MYMARLAGGRVQSLAADVTLTEQKIDALHERDLPDVKHGWRVGACYASSRRTAC